MKRCSKCGEEKPLEEFSPSPRTSTGRRPECKACNRLYQRERRAKDPEKVRAITRRSRMRNATASASWTLRKYGVTAGDYFGIVAAQGGVCAICGKPESDPRRSRLSLDHNHTTGQIRGALCSRCNTAIGLLGDDPELIDTAAAYLRSWQKGKAA
jgi:hypothetical protein